MKRLDETYPGTCSSVLRYWSDPAPSETGDNHLDFVRNLGGPTRLEIPGRDPDRCRVLVTLLHGNEPSGIKAVFDLIRERVRPAVTIYCYILGVEAALCEPVFTHRQVPGKRDYNRCFQPPFDIDEQGRVCRTVLDEIKALQPEIVIDMHNTSGEGPSFAVTTSLDVRYEPVISLFTERLIVTDLRLGALMETDTEQVPVVTIECGGAFEASANRIAREGLLRFFTETGLDTPPEADWGLDVYLHPLRMEITGRWRVAYAETPAPDADITLRVDIEHFNFRSVSEQTPLGWVRPDAASALAVFDSGHNNQFGRFYRIESGCLYPAMPQKLFMVTSDPVIAASDCLWYCVPDDESRESTPI